MEPRTDVPLPPIWGLPPVHEYPERHVHPVTIVHSEVVQQPEAPQPRQTIPKNSGNNSETIPNNSKRIPKKAAPVEQVIPDAPSVPMLNIPDFQMESSVGRKRKYEDEGIYGDISVQDVVLYRHVRKRHFPNLSSDMKYWYEHFYFKPPKVGEKPFRGKDYEQHKRAYERGREWIAAHDAATQTLGNSGSAVIPFRQRANN